MKNETTLKRLFGKKTLERTHNNELIRHIDIILKDIKKNCVSKEHRHDEINWDCPECKFRILEGGLEWYKDMIEWENKCDL